MAIYSFRDTFDIFRCPPPPFPLPQLVFALVALAAAEEMVEEKKEELKLVSPYFGHPYLHSYPYGHSFYNYPYTYAHPLTYKLPEIKPLEIKPIEYKLPEIKPITYTYQPVETKLVPKEYEVPVHSVEYEKVDSACTNV